MGEVDGGEEREGERESGCKEMPKAEGGRFRGAEEEK